MKALRIGVDEPHTNELCVTYRATVALTQTVVRKRRGNVTLAGRHTAIK